MLNFNVDPYYDDFDPSKNFHRILFKPGKAVQARELTQSQTILQDQISKFASHIFSQNTPVTGGKITTNLTCSFIKLNATYNGVAVVASDFLNKTITNSNGTVIAKVIATAEATGTSTEPGDPPTLIVNYLSGVKFSDGQTITSTTDNLFATTIGVAGGTTCTGFSSVASIADGVFYVVNGYSISSTQNEDGSFSKYSIGNFVSVTPQTVILSKYSRVPSVRVGLEINETIVDYVDDASLLDPAIGASNYQAPGADRYKISLDLVSLPLSLGSDNAFIELLRIENGNVVKQVDSTEYARLDDYFAKRDYEAHGNYVVNDFKLTASQHPGDSNYYDLSVGKGIAYVNGYRIENQSDLVLINPRARETQTVVDNLVYVDYGSYFYVDNLNQTFDVTTIPSVDLHCVPSGSIATANSNSYTSTLVGKGRIRNLTYVDDTSDSNTLTYVYKSYISDIDLNSLSGNATSSSTSTTIQFFNNGKYSTVNGAYVGVTLVVSSGTSIGDVRTITAWNASTRTATVDSPFTVNPDTTTQFSLLFAVKDIESIVQKQSDTVFTLTASSEINALRGKVSGIASGDTILENQTAPAELVYNVGSNYVSDISNATYFSTKVFRNKTFTSVGPSSSLTLTMPAGASLQFTGTGTLTPSAAKQLFIVIDKSTGQPLDFASSGNTVTITGGSTATFTSPVYSGKTVDIICNTIDVNGDTTNLVLKSKNLVTGNTSIVSNTGPSGIIGNTYVDLTNAQVYIKSADVTTGSISLYVTDVKRIVRIINTKNANTEPTVAMLTDSSHDVTSLFTLNNGQRDTFYDHASISLKPGANKPIGNLLVIFDYYSHDGGDGYFNVNSYLNPISTSPENYAEIPSYISKRGTQYNLANCIDFRASRVNATSSFVFEYTGNPASDDTGALIPSNQTSFNSDYSFYLGRFDKLVLTKDREFLIVNGYSSINPQLPVEPEGSMVLAELFHDPYTAYIPGENPVTQRANLSINKVVYKRWTKDEITQLQTRVENLEYYTSLSLLERDADSLNVVDENGINRFKNGILVDDFSSYAAADTYNDDFVSSINIRKQQLLPLSDVQNFQLQNPIVLGGLGTVTQFNNYAINNINGTKTNIFTLPYTTANVVTQPLASSTLSVNPFTVIVQQGILKLNPPMDNWVDTDIAPSITTNSPAYSISQTINGGLNATNAGDFASIVGTPITTASSYSSTNAINPDNSNYTFNAPPVTQTTTTALALNNGFVVNNAIAPYIRQQQIIVRAKGLLLNSPIDCWFDGYKVNDFMTTPNTIELENVTGDFKEDDVIGFFYNDKFNFVGRVVSVYKYSSTKVRLYVACIEGLLSAPAGTRLQNGLFDFQGTYIGTTASGDVLGDTVTSIHTSGKISGVGNTYTLGATTSTIYRIKNPNNWGTFLNQYGSWANLRYDNEGNSLTAYTQSLVIDFPATGTYTFQVSSSSSSTTQLDGSTIITHSNPKTVSNYSATVSSGNHTIAWNAAIPNGPGGYALVIKNSAGNIIFDTTNLSSAVQLDGVDSYYQMSGGGYFYTGVTKLKLEPNASQSSDYYVGSKITVTATYVEETVLQTATYVPPPPPPEEKPKPPRPVVVPPPVEPPPPDYYTYDDWIVDPEIWGLTTSGGNIPLPTSRTKSIGISLANTYYKGQFGRLPDSTGLAFWTNECITKFNGNPGDPTLGAAIIFAGQLNGEETYTGGPIKTNGSGGDFWDKP